MGRFYDFLSPTLPQVDKLQRQRNLLIFTLYTDVFLHCEITLAVYDCVVYCMYIYICSRQNLCRSYFNYPTLDIVYYIKKGELCCRNTLKKGLSLMMKNLMECLTLFLDFTKLSHRLSNRRAPVLKLVSYDMFSYLVKITTRPPNT